MQTRLSYDVLSVSYDRIQQVVIPNGVTGTSDKGLVGVTNLLLDGVPTSTAVALDAVWAWACLLKRLGQKPVTTRVKVVGLANGSLAQRCAYQNYVNNCLGVMKAVNEDVYDQYKGGIDEDYIMLKVINKKYRSMIVAGVQLPLVMR